MSNPKELAQAQIEQALASGEAWRVLWLEGPRHYEIDNYCGGFGGQQDTRQNTRNTGCDAERSGLAESFGPGDHEPIICNGITGPDGVQHRAGHIQQDVCTGTLGGETVAVARYAASGSTEYVGRELPFWTPGDGSAQEDFYPGRRD